MNRLAQKVAAHPEWADGAFFTTTAGDARELVAVARDLAEALVRARPLLYAYDHSTLSFSDNLLARARALGVAP